MTAQQAQDTGARELKARVGRRNGAIAGDAGTGAAVGAVHGRRKEKRAERKADDRLRTRNIDGCIQSVLFLHDRAQVRVERSALRSPCPPVLELESE